MFETLDIMISLGVVFLVLSMVHKYLMSMIKRLLKIKAKVIAGEMETFVGENTSKLLIPYLEKKAKHLNFLEDIKKKRWWRRERKKGLREISKKQLEETVNKLAEFLNGKDGKKIEEEIDAKVNVKEIDEKINEIKDHLGTLKDRIRYVYDNTMEKMTEVYETRLRGHTLIWGLVLAVFINADFFDIYSSLSKNSLVRGKLVAQVEVIDRQMELMSEQIEQKEGEEINRLQPLITETKKNLSNLTGELDKAGLSLGWTKEKFSQAFEGLGAFVNKLLGLFVSGLLISFGAPFWHDLLSAFTGLRRRLRKRE